MQQNRTILNGYAYDLPLSCQWDSSTPVLKMKLVNTVVMSLASEQTKMESLNSVLTNAMQTIELKSCPVW